MIPAGRPVANCPECRAEPHRDDCARMAQFPEGLHKVVRRGEELRRRGLRVYGNQLLGTDGRPVSDSDAEAMLQEAGLGK